MTALSLINLTKRYDGVSAALDNLCLDVNSGEFFALLGPSGCGKTTALRIVAGLLDATSGDVKFDGQSVLGLVPEKRDAVMVFQNHLLFPHMNVSDNVSFGLRMRGLDVPVRRKRAAEMLERVGLPGCERRKPSELSGGQQQRVALARALVTKPRMLLLDEPLASLDAALREEMRELLRVLYQEFRITTVLVTHDQQEAVTLASRIALLDSGKLLQCGTPQSFFDAPESILVARFFGGKNFFKATYRDGEVHTRFGRLRVQRKFKSASATVTIRPEHIIVGPSRVNAVEVVLTEKAFLGAQTRLRFHAGPETLEVLVSPAVGEQLVPGSAATVSLPPDKLILLDDAS